MKTAGRLLSLLSVAFLLCQLPPSHVVGPRLRAADCNANGTEDSEDLALGAADDCNLNGIPDECDLRPGALAFEAPLEFYLGRGSPETTMLEDMDGDGDLDIISVLQYDGAGGGVSVFRNNGARSFTPILQRAGGPIPSGPMLADVDGDGDLDLATMNTPAVASASFIEVLRNPGNGRLAIGGQYPIDENPRGLILADLDGDGDPDAAVASRDRDTVSVLLNDGGGGFGPPAVHTSGPNPRRLTAEDLDGDGRRDLAFLHGLEEEPGTLKVLINMGAGAFRDGPSMTVGQFPVGLEAADLDGDGDMDLVSSNYDSADVSLLLNDGAGTFGPATHVGIGDEKGAEKMTLADLNGDGLPDLVNCKYDILLIREEDAGEVQHNFVSVLLNEGGGRFAPPAVMRYPAVRGGGPHIAKPLDADGDGDLDLATPLVSSTGRLPLLLNDGRGSFPAYAARVEVTSSLDGQGRPRSVAAGDLDGDGLVDLVCGVSNGSPRGARVSILFRQSGSAFASGCAEFLRGDMNADGQVSIADVIAYRLSNHIDFGVLTCPDTADVDDNEGLDSNITLARALFQVPDWSTLIPEPSLAPGRDPTPAPVGRTSPPLGCRSHDVVPPVGTGDLLRLGDAAGAPGQAVRIPVHVTASVPVDGFQLVVTYDPAVLQIDCGHEDDCSAAVSFEGTVWNEAGVIGPTYSDLTLHPAHGVFTLWMMSTMIDEGLRLPVRDDMLVAWIHATISPSAAPETVVRLELTNGPDEQGVGPYRLRNELASSRDARMVSRFPRTGEGILQIVGDQSFYRADADGDEHVTLTDAVHTLNWLFLGGRRTDCMDAADANDDGIVTLTDAVFTLNFLFTTGRALPAPHPQRGPDATADALHCYRIRPSVP